MYSHSEAESAVALVSVLALQREPHVRYTLADVLAPSRLVDLARRRLRRGVDADKMVPRQRVERAVVIPAPFIKSEVSTVFIDDHQCRA